MIPQFFLVISTESLEALPLCGSGEMFAPLLRVHNIFIVPEVPRRNAQLLWEAIQ